MEAFANRIKTLFADQEVRITAALQLILCFFAITSAVRKEFHIDQKNRKKVSRKRK